MLDLREAPQPTCLTAEELRVAALVGQGYWGVQLADLLALEEEDVAQHLSAALEKLGLSRRLDLQVYATLRIPEACS